MARAFFRARSGYVVLAVLGVVYTIGAISVLVLFAVEGWNALSLIDRAMLAALAAAAVCGVWFLNFALEHLGIHLRRVTH
jgi:hypothetical protein